MILNSDTINSTFRRSGELGTLKWFSIDLSMMVLYINSCIDWCDEQQYMFTQGMGLLLEVSQSKESLGKPTTYPFC